MSIPLTDNRVRTAFRQLSINEANPPKSNEKVVVSNPEPASGDAIQCHGSTRKLTAQNIDATQSQQSPDKCSHSISRSRTNKGCNIIKMWQRNVENHEQEMRSIQEQSDLLQKERDKLEEEKLRSQEDFKKVHASMEELKKCLSMSIHKVSAPLPNVGQEHEIEVRFTNISEKEPEREFTVAIYNPLLNKKCYRVTDRETVADEEFESLVDELNRTNDLRGFLISMRRRYVKLAQQHP